MWSDRYLYYIIRSDGNYSQSLPTNDVIKVLKNTNVLKQNGPQAFVNLENFPWISVTCVNSKDGNYSDNQTDFTNLITVVASKHEPSNASSYTELLSRIARDLNWELVLEEDDAGNENVVLT